MRQVVPENATQLRASQLFWVGFIILAAIVGGMLWVVVNLLLSPADASFQLTLGDALPISLALVVVCFCTYLGWKNAERKAQEAEQRATDAEQRALTLEQSQSELGRTRSTVRIYPEGIEQSDYKLLELALTPYLGKNREIALYPLQDGFTSAMVFQIDFPSNESAVLKLSERGDVESEAQNYNDYVRSKLSIPQLQKPMYNESRGVLLYTYAGLTVERSISFERFFLDKDRETKDVEKILRKLFMRIRFWYTEKAPVKMLLYRNYQMEEKGWGRIATAIHELEDIIPPDCFDGINPLAILEDARGLFSTRQRALIDTLQSIVHGDLNARNILIDGDGNVFVIDFAKTGEGCLLRDFCKLETEIRYCLTRLLRHKDVQAAVDLERRLLLDDDGKPFSTLKDILKVNLDSHPDIKLNRMLQSIKVLREIAMDFWNEALSAKGSAEQYYIILLHHTIDVLRYRQPTHWSKVVALKSAALLCEALHQAGSQHREH
jgi:hypothetical protein